MNQNNTNRTAPSILAVMKQMLPAEDQARLDEVRDSVMRRALCANFYAKSVDLADEPLTWGQSCAYNAIASALTGHLEQADMEYADALLYAGITPANIGMIETIVDSVPPGDVDRQIRLYLTRQRAL